MCMLIKLCGMFLINIESNFVSFLNLYKQIKFYRNTLAMEV